MSPEPPHPLAAPPEPGPTTPVRLMPSELYNVANRFLAAQDECEAIHNRLLQQMANNANVVGKDDSGSKFAADYRMYAETALDGFVRAHTLLGAFAEGLAISAENHRKADADSTPPGHPTSEPLPPLNPHSPPPRGDIAPIGDATAFWLVAPLDGLWPLSDPAKALDLANAFQVAQRDFAGMVDKLHNDFRGLITSNDSGDLQAAEAFFARVTSDAVLDGLPRLLGEIDKAITEYKRQVESWKERFDAALKEGLAAAGCVVLGALIFNILTEVGWGGLGVEASAASAAAVRAITPVAAAFAGAAQVATAGAVAGAGVFTVEMARTPDPNVARSEGTSFGDTAGEQESPGSASKLSSSDQRAVDSYERLISEHEAKLEAYKRDPYSFDNKGILKNAPNDEIRQRIINGRIAHLEQEIKTFRENIYKIYNKGP